MSNPNSEVESQLNRQLTANVHLKKRRVIWLNFVGGMAWGVGSVIGATVVIGLLVWIFSFFNFVPFLGDFLSGITDQINRNAPR